MIIYFPVVKAQSITFFVQTVTDFLKDVKTDTWMLQMYLILCLQFTTWSGRSYLFIQRIQTRVIFFEIDNYRFSSQRRAYQRVTEKVDSISVRSISAPSHLQSKIITVQLRHALRCKPRWYSVKKPLRSKQSKYSWHRLPRHADNKFSLFTSETACTGKRAFFLSDPTG